MANFQERIKALRLQNNLTQLQVGQAIGADDRAYRAYELGSREPGMNKLIALADYFNVSIDYLVGRSDDPILRRKEGDN